MMAIITDICRAHRNAAASQSDRQLVSSRICEALIPLLRVALREQRVPINDNHNDPCPGPDQVCETLSELLESFFSVTDTSTTTNNPIDDFLGLITNANANNTNFFITDTNINTNTATTNANETDISELMLSAGVAEVLVSVLKLHARQATSPLTEKVRSHCIHFPHLIFNSAFFGFLERFLV
jgi:hypothetical protein